MNVLVSYFFARRDADRWDYWLSQAKERGWNVLIDSGAFSAFTQKQEIDLDAYCRFIERRLPWLWDFISLDVVNNSQATLSNLEVMSRRGLKPMAVLTEDMQPDVVPQLLQTAQNDRLCVAGPTHWPTQPILARIRLVKQIAPQAQIHGLGLTRETAAWRCGVSSVDSSTWTVGTRYGKFSTFTFYRGCKEHDWRLLRQGDRNQWPSDVQQTVLQCSITKQDIESKWFNRGVLSGLNLITCFAWLQFVEFATKRNVKVFFATGSLQQLIPLAAANKMCEGATLRQAYEFGSGLLDLWKEDRSKAVDVLLATKWPF